MNKVLWNVMPCSLVDGEQSFSVTAGVSVPSEHSYQTVHLHSPHLNLKKFCSQLCELQRRWLLACMECTQAGNMNKIKSGS